MRPVLIINPRNDPAFVERATGMVEAGIDDPAVLQVRLRERHPDAVVRPRELSSEPAIIWYVYRDGHWIPEQATQEVEPDGS